MGHFAKVRFKHFQTRTTVVNDKIIEIKCHKSFSTSHFFHFLMEKRGFHSKHTNKSTSIQNNSKSAPHNFDPNWVSNSGTAQKKLILPLGMNKIIITSFAFIWCTKFASRRKWPDNGYNRLHYYGHTFHFPRRARQWKRAFFHDTSWKHHTQKKHFPWSRLDEV